MMGPNNPIFGNQVDLNNKFQPQNNPNFRFDPVFPNGLDPEPDNDLFNPQDFMNNRRGGGGGFGPFGGGGLGGMGGGF